MIIKLWLSYFSVPASILRIESVAEGTLIVYPLAEWSFSPTSIKYFLNICGVLDDQITMGSKTDVVLVLMELTVWSLRFMVVALITTLFYPLQN